MFYAGAGQHLEALECIDPTVVLKALQDGDHFILVTVLAIYHVAIEALILRSDVGGEDTWVVRAHNDRRNGLAFLLPL